MTGVVGRRPSFYSFTGSCNHHDIDPFAYLWARSTRTVSGEEGAKLWINAQPHKLFSVASIDPGKHCVQYRWSSDRRGGWFIGLLVRWRRGWAFARRNAHS